MVESFWSPIIISIRIALLATLIEILTGILFAWIMARTSFRGKSLLETCLLLPLVLPPTAVGLFLLAVLGKDGLERFLPIPFIFTYWGAVAAAVVVSFPLVYQTFKTAFSSLDPELEFAAKCDGANDWQVFLHIYLPLSRRAMITAVILGFARSLGEFGATLLVAGNIPGRTQTLPMAMYMAIESGQNRLALLWALCSAALSFALLLFVQHLPGRQK
ncbi:MULTISPECIES: molybdate ABC transporter permease subunit [Thermoactinomyces]|uniref:Molybdenum transport system permease n=1 Tax=Thermoactinomyces daqus TaxID=1329516 RepID=A0A7W2AII4_9BACL|nr:MULTISPECIES: molybdate ABC transporter permease subunit [Thermoactinomyces]MBA4543796.1 molybdate ABC transporter permease subunit [Thermoactinomyces daqus]MBH8598419.1 molybdate ABC transporter permease subunit [Thermoactinomyces sp. CICC 10523]MBH8604544.1 molybdate ABC transporter permease subunit [Thermoactinomyces sp. CICC 10522]MBH8607453.1 molybdate ABC transporter permease subunit [Thermoactinomyces sp. CICC 10521]